MLSLQNVHNQFHRLSLIILARQDKTRKTRKEKRKEEQTMQDKTKTREHKTKQRYRQDNLINIKTNIKALHHFDGCTTQAKEELRLQRTFHSRIFPPYVCTKHNKTKRGEFDEK
jgi:hypothetical protein